MRVTGVETWQVVVPIRPGVVNSACYPDQVLDHWTEIPKHVIRITTASGYTGFGETNRGVSADQVAAGAKAVMDQELDKLPLFQLPLPRNGAYDAFEMAIIDCLGHAREVPAWVLLGGKYHDEIPVDFWMGLMTPEDTAERVKVGLAAGFHGVKFKCKLEQQPAERVAAVKELAPDWTITLDPNERFYRPSGALELARRIEQYEGILFESPFPQRRLDWYARMRDTLRVPLALHLGAIDSLIPALEQGCADVYNLNGSMTEFVISTRAAHAAGCPVWHGSGNDIGIRDASFVHACAATPAELWPSDILGHWLREDDLLEGGLGLENGRIQVTDQPGLGITVDMAALERYTVKQA